MPRCTPTLLACYLALTLAACGTAAPAATTAPTATAAPAATTAPLPTATTVPAKASGAGSGTTTAGPVLAVTETTNPRAFTFRVMGLQDNVPYQVIIRDPTGKTDTVTRPAPPGGILSDTYQLDPPDPAGEYTIEIRTGDGATLLASAKHTVKQ